MLKMYYQLTESAEFLNAETRNPVSARDLLEAAARGKIRACFWFDGILTTFRDEGPLVDPTCASGPYEFRGYVQVPARSISPNGDVSSFNAASIIEVTDSIYGEPMPSNWTCGAHFMGQYDVDIETGDIRHIPFHVSLDDIVIPARDLLDLVPRNQCAEKSLSTTERNTLLTIIAALCKYEGLDPQERGMAQRIMEMTDDLGAHVDDGTILTSLKKIPSALETRMK